MDRIKTIVFVLIFFVNMFPSNKTNGSYIKNGLRPLSAFIHQPPSSDPDDPSVHYTYSTHRVMAKAGFNFMLFGVKKINNNFRNSLNFSGLIELHDTRFFIIPWELWRGVIKLEYLTGWRILSSLPENHILNMNFKLAVYKDTGQITYLTIDDIYYRLKDLNTINTSNAIRSFEGIGFKIYLDYQYKILIIRNGIGLKVHYSILRNFDDIQPTPDFTFLNEGSIGVKLNKKYYLWISYYYDRLYYNKTYIGPVKQRINFFRTDILFEKRGEFGISFLPFIYLQKGNGRGMDQFLLYKEFGGGIRYNF